MDPGWWNCWVACALLLAGVLVPGRALGGVDEREQILRAALTLFEGALTAVVVDARTAAGDRAAAGRILPVVELGGIHTGLDEQAPAGLLRL